MLNHLFKTYIVKRPSFGSQDVYGQPTITFTTYTDVLARVESQQSNRYQTQLLPEGTRPNEKTIVYFKDFEPLEKDELYLGSIFLGHIRDIYFAFAPSGNNKDHYEATLENL